YLMWGLWLFTHAVAFSTGRVAHEFYVVAAAPAIAALAGGGAVTLWAAWRRGGRRRWALPATIALTLAWTLHLSLRFRTFLPWLAGSAAVLAALAVAGLVAAPTLRARYRRLGSAAGSGRSGRLAAVAAGFGVVACLITPAGWAASSIDSAYRGSGAGPAAGPRTDSGTGGPPGILARFPGAGKPPGGVRPGAGPGPATSNGVPPAAGPSGGDRSAPAGATPSGDGGFAPNVSDEPSEDTTALLNYLKRSQPGRTYLFAAQGLQAIPYLLAGASVLPLGGFSGQVPFPTVDRLEQLITTGELRYVLLGGGGPGAFGRFAANNLGGGEGNATAVSTWVTAHCTAIDANGTQVYDCAAH
ncbi:hypothetical protein AB0B31_24940, partial [Catellatospora citrea]